MSKRTSIALRAANAQADALARMLDGGMLRIYNGRQPLTADNGVTGTVLVEVKFASPCAKPATDGTVTFEGFEPARAKESGTATWFRCFAPGGEPVLDGSVGEANANLVFDSADLRRNAQIILSTLTHTVER